MKWFILLAVLGASVLIVRDRWSLIWSNILWYSKPGVTGWPSPTLRLGSWLGLPPTSDGTMVLLAEWLLLSTIVISTSYILVRKFSSRENFSVFMILIALNSGYIALSFKIGTDTYQTWKFLVTVQPLISIFIFLALRNIYVYFSKSMSKHVQRSMAVICISIVTLFMFYNAMQSRFMYFSGLQVPNMELESAAKSPSVRGRPNLLIRMNPYLETMISPVILDLHDAIYASDTYLGPASPIDPRCAISNIENEESTPLSGGLFLGPIEDCLED